MTSIEQILNDLGETSTLHDILRVVYVYYLTDKEKEHYQILLLYYSGKPQRELGILLNVQQYKVSEYLSSLLRKMKKISSVFVYHRTKLVRFLCFLKKHATPRQYQVICYLLAGNKQCNVARYLSCSPAAIFYTLRQIRHHLSPTRQVTFNKYLHTFLNQ
jgi:DNA-binding CsgD family transcriptional regulator